MQAHKGTWHGWTRAAAFSKWVPYLRLALPSLLLISEWWASEVPP